MNLLRRLIGTRDRVTIATSPGAAMAVADAVSALQVPGAYIGSVHTQVMERTALTTVRYRYHHPHAEQRLLAEIQHASKTASAGGGQRGVRVVLEVAHVVDELGLNLTDWQREILGRLT